MQIEQGPVLESRGEPAATVLGTCGVERHVAVFTGVAIEAYGRAVRAAVAAAAAGELPPRP
jgi:hypothetical protein